MSHRPLNVILTTLTPKLTILRFTFITARNNDLSLNCQISQTDVQGKLSVEIRVFLNRQLLCA